MPLLLFNNVTLGYGGHPAVHHLDGAVEAGSLTAIVGPNGAGKSTLLKGIAGLIRPLGGTIEKPEIGPADTAYLPQQSEIDRSFPASVADLVALGLWRQRGMTGRINAGDRAAIDAALAAVGLAGFRRRGLDTLSGGQFQRALFARVILQDAKLILLDEPFNAIETSTVADLLGIIKGWRREARAVLAVLHDLDLVRANFPDALLLARRPIAWGATAETLSAANLLQARRLNESWVEGAPVCAEREAA